MKLLLSISLVQCRGDKKRFKTIEGIAGDLKTQWNGKTSLRSQSELLLLTYLDILLHIISL